MMVRHLWIDQLYGRAFTYGVDSLVMCVLASALTITLNVAVLKRESLLAAFI
jgi:hypothetical protein